MESQPKSGALQSRRCEIIEEIDQLACSINRVRILEYLADHSHVDRDELRAEFDIARTTLQRNLDVLDRLGWITNSGVEYDITPCGAHVADEFGKLIETVAVTRRIGPVMQYLDASVLGFDLEHLADADVWVAESGNPYAMINQHVHRLRQMDSAKALLPITGLHAFEAVHESILDQGATAEVVVERSVADTHQTDPHYADLFEELVATDRFESYVLDGEITVPVSIIDDTVQILVTEDEEPRALLETGSDAVHQWAARIFKDHKRRATPLE